MKTLSVIIPVFNEEGNLDSLYEKLVEVFAKLPNVTSEILLIDDHSTDKTTSILERLAKKDSRVKWVRLSRNSGSHTACCAGLEHANSDASVIISADLQDPPEIILKLFEEFEKGAQLVWGVREERLGESWFTLTASRLFYFLMNRISDLRLPPRGADVLLADRKVVQAFRQMPERNISLFAAFSWLGFCQARVSYVKQARNAGSSKWTIRKKLVLAIDSFVGFSYLPLRFMSYLGFIIAGLGFLWALAIFFMRLYGITQLTGFASMMVTILILGGLQMLMLGVLGEYLWRTLEESRRRPRYFVERTNVSLIEAGKN